MCNWDIWFSVNSSSWSISTRLLRGQNYLNPKSKQPVYHIDIQQHLKHVIFLIFYSMRNLQCLLHLTSSPIMPLIQKDVPPKVAEMGPSYPFWRVVGSSGHLAAPGCFLKLHLGKQFTAKGERGRKELPGPVLPKSPTPSHPSRSFSLTYCRSRVLFPSA